jgi:tRNA-specific 2-thiouridylase
MTRIYVGMSGGVDSSLAAALLLERGFEVTGIYMKNWSQDLPGMKCPWAEDLADAKRVAVQLGIDFKVFDFEKEYKHYVVDYMVEEYKACRTPNPDIMCNKEIKFGLFLKWALSEGFDYVATGHYAGIGLSDSGQGSSFKSEFDLLSGVDEGKDQSYFLFRISQEALSHSLFPLGDYTKSQTRELAKKFNLATAEKPDSVGICFIGDINVSDFIREHVEVKKGPVVNGQGEVIGEHEGVPLYTIGQRHGFRLDKYVGMPVYVVKKDARANTIVVGFAKDSEVKEFEVGELSFIRSAYESLFEEAGEEGLKCSVRIRNLGEKMACKVSLRKGLGKNVSEDGNEVLGNGGGQEVQQAKVLRVDLEEYTVGVAPGQSAVFYDFEEKGKVLGGGVIRTQL